MKKLFVLVPIIALLAAGCGSSKPVDNSNNQSAQTQPNSPASSNKPAASPTGDTWQGTLQASDNTQNGNYMITVSGRKIYLNTGRDYSSLVGKSVNVSYSGTLASFVLNDITAQ